MAQFIHVFDSGLAKDIFIVGFIICSGYGILLRHSIEVSARRIVLSARTAMTALVLAAIGSMGLLSTRSSAAASTTAVIAKRPWQPWQ